MNAVSKTQAADDSLPLLCALGRHAPERLPVWNDGYYFARCGRCHRDIVRPLDGKWEIPRGFRVVWRPDRPETEATPLLVNAGRRAAPAGISEPAQVAESARAGEVAQPAEAAEPGKSSEAAEAAEPTRSVAPAFGIAGLALGPGLGEPRDDTAAAADPSPDTAVGEHAPEPLSDDGPAADAGSNVTGPDGAPAEAPVPSPEHAEDDVMAWTDKSYRHIEPEPEPEVAAGTVAASMAASQPFVADPADATTDAAETEPASEGATGDAPGAAQIEAPIEAGASDGAAREEPFAEAPAAEDEPTSEPPMDDQVAGEHSADEQPNEEEPASWDEPVEDPQPGVWTSLIPDFMDDGAAPAPFPPRQPAPPAPAPELAAAPAAPVPPLPPHAPAALAVEPAAAVGVRSELERIGLGNLAAMSNRVFRDDGEAPATAAPPPASEPSRAVSPAAVIGAILVAVLLTFVSTVAWERAREPVLLAANGDLYRIPKLASRTSAPADVRLDPSITPSAANRPSSAQSAPGQSSLAQSSGIASSSDQSAQTPGGASAGDKPAKTIAASVANCRAMPADGAPVTMKFLRGAEVQMEAERGEWANVSHRGRSCWVQTQLLADS